MVVENDKLKKQGMKRKSLIVTRYREYFAQCSLISEWLQELKESLKYLDSKLMEPCRIFLEE